MNTISTLEQTLERFRKMEDVGILQKTAVLLEEYCGEKNLMPYSALDVLTLLLCYAQYRPLIRPENSMHDEIASLPDFASLSMSIKEMVHGDRAQRAQIQAWIPFIQVAISDLRGPAFTKTTFFSAIIDGKDTLIEVDDSAHQIIKEMRRCVESSEGSQSTTDALARLKVQLRSPKEVSFEAVQLWNRFLYRSVPVELHDALNEHLLTVVTHGVTMPAQTSSMLASTITPAAAAA